MVKTMKALDQMVAIRVMGWHRGTNETIKYPFGVTGQPIKRMRHAFEYDRYWYDDKGLEQARAMSIETCMDCWQEDEAWSPSTNIEDAWDVVEKFAPKLAFQIDAVGHPPNIWRCMIGWGDDPISVFEEAETAPHAICLAALEAVKNG